LAQRPVPQFSGLQTESSSWLRVQPKHRKTSHHYTLDEIKAAIGVLTSRVEQLIASVQQMQSQTLELTAETSLQGEIRQELRDLLKELE
jgi:hypothetical protein